MASVGFGETDDDLRAAWRGRLEREGKLAAGSSLADLMLDRRGGPGEPGEPGGHSEADEPGDAR